MITTGAIRASYRHQGKCSLLSNYETRFKRCFPFSQNIKEYNIRGQKPLFLAGIEVK